MTRIVPFVYPAAPHVRKHAPAGYANYGDFKPWLRDEFVFRCVSCLEREMWYPNRAASFSVDHVVPQKDDPSRICDYSNLVYPCTRCNSLKGRTRLIDPTAVTAGNHLLVEADGRIRAPSDDGEFLVRLLHLNEDPALSQRKYRQKSRRLRRSYPIT